MTLTKGILTKVTKVYRFNIILYLCDYLQRNENCKVYIL